MIPDTYDELLADVAEERISTRIAELDRETGRVDLDQPEPPTEEFWAGEEMLPPREDAVGGDVEVVRSGFVAKYDPEHPDRGSDFDSTDPFWEFDWADPASAISRPWLVSRHRGLGVIVDRGDLVAGDLVFMLRTRGAGGERQSHPWLARRTLVGVCWVESVGVDWRGPAATLFPIRRFDFPVPVNETGHVDAVFRDVEAFRDRARRSMVELAPSELLAVVRDCGLPVELLTEPDPDRLGPLCQGLDLGPPHVVRRRILEGARAQDHRDRVERSAINHVVRVARSRGRFGVADTQKIRGAHGPGADLWLNAEDGNGDPVSARVEVKGLSGSDPWTARLTRNELAAAKRAGAGGEAWWLVIVTDALAQPSEVWLTASEVVQVFTKPDRAGDVFSVDRTEASRLNLG